MHQNQTDIRLGRVLPNQPITIRTRLDEQNDSTDMVGPGVDVAIRVTRMGICVEFDGYGDPILIEQYDGHPMVRIWSDITQEDPTHEVSLEGALERETDVCGSCDGSGILTDVDPSEGLFRRTIQKCDACGKYAEDIDAARALSAQDPHFIFYVRDRNTGLPIAWDDPDPNARPVCVPDYELSALLERILEKRAGKK